MSAKILDLSSRLKKARDEKDDVMNTIKGFIKALNSDDFDGDFFGEVLKSVAGSWQFYLDAENLVGDGIHWRGAVVPMFTVDGDEHFVRELKITFVPVTTGSSDEDWVLSRHHLILGRLEGEKRFAALETVSPVVFYETWLKEEYERTGQITPEIYLYGFILDDLMEKGFKLDWVDTTQGPLIMHLLKGENTVTLQVSYDAIAMAGAKIEKYVVDNNITIPT